VIPPQFAGILQHRPLQAQTLCPDT